MPIRFLHGMHKTGSMLDSLADMRADVWFPNLHLRAMCFQELRGRGGMCPLLK